MSGIFYIKIINQHLSRVVGAIFIRFPQFWG
uniref:Uncharacterized protein n=1 Tax=Siphoviridae sp. ctKFk2 TaxID=2827841 RepID=A0A8S5T0E6_9CAUD|nr:MAG TPA: hypothetical protein [Siphoviridae sp. ctKFk2]DAM67895.1 MAG TPA: hypothetical protein [Caudoviricetes sp.]